MTTATAAPERFDIGRVFSSGFAIVGRRPVTLIVLVAILAYLPTAATLWLTAHVLPPPTPGAPPNVPAILQRLGFGELLRVFVGGFDWILQGAVAVAALSDLRGRPLSLGAVLARTAPRMPVVYAVGFVATLGVALGTIVFIVPGVLLALAWSVGGAVAMVEKPGFGAIGRCVGLTRENRLSLFIIFLTWGVAAVVVGIIAGIIGAPAIIAGGGRSPLWFTLGLQPLASAIVQVFSTATLVAAYVELRGVKDGLAASSLASQFD
jgi:hypothetical protein